MDVDVEREDEVQGMDVIGLVKAMDGVRPWPEGGGGGGDSM